jgi:hypothetical protein
LSVASVLALLSGGRLGVEMGGAAL